MAVSIALKKMTIPDKLRTMETIWDDLRRTPEEVPSPAWHADVLHAREMRVREGRSSFGNWSDAKRRIRECTK
jgi:hypothetical protein